MGFNQDELVASLNESLDRQGQRVYYCSESTSYGECGVARADKKSPASSPRDPWRYPRCCHVVVAPVRLTARPEVLSVRV